MTSERIVWVARGACASCGQAIAKRMEGAGRTVVACGACKGTSTFAAVAIDLDDPAQVALPTRGQASSVASEGVARARLDEVAPKARLHARRRILAGALAGILLLGGIAAGAAFLRSGGEDWTMISYEVVPHFGDEEVVFTMRVQGLDAESREIPPARLRDVGLFYFAFDAELKDVRELDWTSCDPRECRFVAPNGTFVFVEHGHPGGPYSVALELRTEKMYQFRSDGFEGANFRYTWQEAGDWHSYFASFGSIRATPVAADANGG